MAPVTEILAQPARRFAVQSVLREGPAAAYRVKDGDDDLVLRLVPEADTDRVRFGGAFRLLATLNHKGITGVRDFGRLDDGRPYVTSTYVEGRSLSEIMPLPPNRVVAIIVALAETLGALHHRGWVHGDLRPGAVRLVGDQAVITAWDRLLPEGHMVGEEGPGGLPYRSPEATRHERIDRRADVYALGALAHALMTGTPPFAAPSRVEMLRAIDDMPATRLDELVPNLPAGLEGLVARMLAKAPADRPAGMDEVLAYLSKQVRTTTELRSGVYLPEGPPAGREIATMRMNTGLDALAGGEGGATALVGEVGMGKSRLLVMLRHQAQLAEVPVISATCPPHPVPYGPIIQLLKQAVPLARAAGATDLAAIGEALAFADPALGRMLSGAAAVPPSVPKRFRAPTGLALADRELGALLATDPSTAGGGSANGASIGAASGFKISRNLVPLSGAREPEREQALIQEAALALLSHAARVGNPLRGLVVTLDDWERADVPSQAALSYIVRSVLRSDGPPLRLVLTTRAGHEPGEPGWELVTLDGLSAAGFATWLQELFGLDEAPRTFAEQLHAYAGGNPGVARDALRHLAEAGVIHASPTGWVLPPKLVAEVLPDGARSMIDMRLGEVSANERRLLALCAVVSVPVDASLADAVLGGGDEAFYAATETLLRLGLVELAGAGVVLRSDVLGAGLVEGLDGATKAAWHSAIACYLEQDADEPGDAPLDLVLRIAQHRAAGANDLASLRWNLEAGARCQDLQAFDQGDALITEAVKRADAMPDDSDTRSMRVAAYHRLARAHTRHHTLDMVEPLIDKAIALAEAVITAPDVLPAEIAEYCEALVSRATYLRLLATGEARQRAIEAHEKAIEVSTAHGVIAASIRALTNLARIHSFVGSADKALALLDRALNQPPEAAPQAHARGLALRGHLRAANRPHLREVGLDDLAKAIDRQGEIGDKYGRGYSMSLLADLYLQGGRWREAAEISAKYVALMAELGMGDDYVIGLLNHALARIELGDLDHACSLARETVAEATRLNHEVGKGLGLPILAWIEVQLGRLSSALARMEMAQETVMAAPPYVIAYAVPFLAGAWLGLGLPDRALSAAQEGQFQLRGHDHGDAAITNEIMLAEIYVAKGDYNLARDFAERAIDGATTAGAKGVLARAAWARALVALKAKDSEEAVLRAEQATALAGPVGAKRVTAMAQGILAEALLLRADPGAMGAFQAMQVLADEVGAPILRAQALDGMARSAPASPSASMYVTDAQRLVRSLLRDLDKEAADRVSAIPAVAELLERHSASLGVGVLSAESNLEMAERLGRVSTDLQSITNHYGLLIREWMSKSGQLEKLNGLSRRINGSLDVDNVLSAVLDVTLELTGADRAYILLKNTGRYDDLLVKAARDRQGRVIRDQRLSMTICTRVFEDGEPTAILDGMGPEALATAKSVVALNLTTVMCAPLICKGRRLGVIYVDCQAALRTYGLADLDQLVAIAAHASTALDNALLYDMLHKRTEELEAAVTKARAAEMAAGSCTLTGLHNRRAFMATADREIGAARRYSRELSLVLLDVDHFKQFNDTYGHLLGDEVLRAVGRTLIAQGRESDFSARLGGEEFVILLPETLPDAAVVFADRVRTALMGLTLTDSDGRPVKTITASFGIAGWSPEDATIDTVLARADKALYAAKHGGRNQVRRWTPDLEGAG